MEDPWSTPWAVDEPSASPGLPPPREEFKGAPGAGGFGERSSPWGEVAPRQHNGGEDGHGDGDEKDNGWGGWDDGKEIAWDARIAPLEEPVDGLATPWGPREEEEDDDDDGDVPDSAAASLGVRTVGRVERKATMLLEDEQDAWRAPREQDAVTAAAPGQELAHAEQVKGVEQVNKVVGEEEELGNSTLDWQSQQQQQQRKASKVQELVDMYDGIAKKAVRPATEPAMREVRLADSAEASQEDVFGQHRVRGGVSDVAKEDDSGEDQGTTASAADAQPPVTKELDLIEKASSLNDGIANEHRGFAPVNTAHDTTSGEQPNPQQPHLATAQPDIQNALYPINLSHLDALFPGTNPASDTPPASVPDTALASTTFTTTSARKTWYRVSRLGSARFHDNGDDEAAYRRVAWPSSDIRTKTLDIVRRWMEQDSIAGRVVLGGGRKAGGPLGASMFGWDDGAPQVEIGELLQLRRRQQQQQRSGHADSKGSSSMMAKRGEDGVQEKTQTMETAGVRSPADMPRSPWDDDEEEEEPPSKQRSSVEAMSPPPKLAEADAWLESISEPAPAQDESAKEGEYGNDNDDNDDDDWGEMVSSPTVDASTTFASLSAPLATTPQQPSSEATLNGLGFVESLAAKPARSNPPPPIRTAGKTSLGSSAAAPSSSSSSSSSPTWTPTLSSPPILEPTTTTRVSADSASQEKPAVVYGALTPTLEAPRASTSSNRVSAEHVRTLAASTPTTTTTTMTTEHRPSTEHAWTATPATDDTNDGAFMETPWTLKAVGPVGATTPSGTPTKHLLDKSVTVTDTCTADEKTVVDEALNSLPDLSYMLH
ncbi:hypothetical protein NHJ13734_008409 [Beauveria thailandica]